MELYENWHKQYTGLYRTVKGHSGPYMAVQFNTGLYRTINNYCQTPDLGQGLEFDFTFANNNKNNDNNDPHLNFPGWDGTRGLKFGTQT